MMARACFPQWTPDGRTDPDMCVVTPRERMGDSQPHTSCRFSWWSWRRTWTPMPFHRLPLRVIVNSRWQCRCPHLLAGVLKRPLPPSCSIRLPCYPSFNWVENVWGVRRTQVRSSHLLELLLCAKAAYAVHVAATRKCMNICVSRKSISSGK